MIRFAFVSAALVAASVAASVLLGSGQAHAQSFLVAPLANTGVEGNAATGNLNGLLLSSQSTFLFVLGTDASGNVTGLNVGDRITGLSFRLDGGVSSNRPFANRTVSDYEIYLGQATQGTGISGAFAGNYQGTTRTQVRDGGLFIPASAFPASASTGPEAFGAEFGFGTFDASGGVLSSASYQYTGGRLVLELRSTGTGSGDNFEFQLDAVNNASSGFGSTFTTGTGAFSATSGTPTGGFIPVVRLSVDSTAAPEAGAGWLALAGLPALGLVARRRAHKA